MIDQGFRACVFRSIDRCASYLGIAAAASFGVAQAAAALTAAAAVTVVAADNKCLIQAPAPLPSLHNRIYTMGCNNSP